MKIHDGRLCSEELCLRVVILGRQTPSLEEIKRFTEEQLSRLMQCNCDILILEKAELLSIINICDVVIIDMTLEENSLETVQLIHDSNPAVKLIILAEDNQYIKWAFKIRAYRYIDKRYIRQEIREALEDAVKEIDKPQGLILEIDGLIQWVLYEDMIYFESAGDMVILYYKDSHVSLKKPLTYLMTVLNADFYQCHKSYIINLKWIKAIREKEILLNNGRTVLVSVRRRSGLLKECYEFVMRNS